MSRALRASLVSLLLGGSSLTDASLQMLLEPIRQNALPRLRMLNLDRNPRLGDVGVAALAAVNERKVAHAAQKSENAKSLCAEAMALWGALTASFSQWRSDYELVLRAAVAKGYEQLLAERAEQAC